MMTKTILVAALLTIPLASSKAEDQLTGSQTVGDDITPNVGAVRRASEMMGVRVIAKGGQDVGRVKDVVIDPFYARVISIIVSPDEQAEREKGLFVPVDAVASAKNGALVLNVKNETVESISLAGQPGNYTRRLSMAAFRHFDITPYWLDKKRDKATANRDDRFVLLSQLQEQAVESPAGTPLGKIRDVVVSKATHNIVYTLFAESGAVSENSASVYPIPLACFVVAGKTANWKLELPAALLENTKSVDKEELPKEISRAWVEYVHVRYGGGVLGGVQRDQK